MSGVGGGSKWTRCTTVVVAVACLWMSQRASTQTPSAAATWAGWARCQLDVQGPGYAERAIHTWTMTGNVPTVEGAFRVYPATWSVVGGGTLQRTNGTQTLTAQWAINAPPVSAPIAVFVRASDGRMFIQARHAQMRSPGAVAGYQQVIIEGKPQPPGQLSAEAFEWAFPVIEVAPTTMSASGSSTPGVNGSVGVMQPAGSRATASCTWQFAAGATPPAAAPVLAAVAVPVPSAGPPAGSTTQSPPIAGGAPSLQPAPFPTGIPTLSPPATTSLTPVPVEGVPTGTLTAAGGTTPSVTGTAPISPRVPNTTTTRVPSFGTVSGTSPIPAPSGTYLVTVTGLICGRNTADNRLQLDGKGDEIYAAAFVRTYDRRSFNVVEYTARQTFVYGDTNQAPDRVQAGSASAIGGIQNFDRIPGDLSVTRLVPAQESKFPWKLWQGTLTNGADALVISPTIWESDGNQSGLSAWVSNQTSLNDRIFLATDVQTQINGNRFGPLTLTSTGTQAFSGGIATTTAQGLFDLSLTVLTGLPSLLTLFGGSYDRPMGMVANGVDSTALPNRVVVLTREIIEAALSATVPTTINTPTPGVLVVAEKSGIMAINFVDDRFNGSLSTLETSGAYYMVLQVERLSN